MILKLIFVPKWGMAKLTWWSVLGYLPGLQEEVQWTGYRSRSDGWDCRIYSSLTEWFHSRNYYSCACIGIKEKTIIEQGFISLEPLWRFCQEHLQLWQLLPVGVQRSKMKLHGTASLSLPHTYALGRSDTLTSASRSSSSRTVKVCLQRAGWSWSEIGSYW